MRELITDRFRKNFVFIWDSGMLLQFICWEIVTLGVLVQNGDYLVRLLRLWAPFRLVLDENGSLLSSTGFGCVDDKHDACQM